ncbi:hypothetical protein FF011L_46310 [Roseimaritima multifibrata]|uniref:SGNH hydrolase-type esterase domain-containing protein n=1 Tax=Roseimaritima multifibrata TaxID=1930274 RepID=A0A517MLV2_9BACT|nr:hypothetical protein [Roseimaritima multifibrata]QDS95830.1 hypothetical protein FF011L_46310 [Roseimaritima multifibrata]
MFLNKILMIGDSFGTERRHGDEIEVSAAKTWPRQVQRMLPNQQFDIDFKGFRRLADCPALLPAKEPYDVLLFQAGIVDVYPRPFPLGFSKSMRLFCRLVRRAVRPWRREWTNYVYSTTWSSQAELQTTFESIDSLSQNAIVVFVTLAPLHKPHALATPGAQESIMDFNDELRHQVRQRDNWFIIDLHAQAIKEGYSHFISPIDSHLNQTGNDWLAKMVATKIQDLKATMDTSTTKVA